MLDKELDKLRDKTLSFWCIIQIIDNEWNFEYWTVLRNNHWFEILALLGKKTNWYNTEYIKKTEIIWHPLTRWRLYQLWHWRKPAYLEVGEPEYDRNEYNKFYLCFENIKDIFYTIWFDKTEIERMKHDKRNELYLLLIEFVQYFK